MQKWFGGGEPSGVMPYRVPEQFPNVVAAAPKLSRDEQFFETAVETILDAVKRTAASRQQH